MKQGVDWYLEGFEDYSHDRLCEETAFEVATRFGWPVSPMLIMWLTRLVDEQIPTNPDD